jgi:hypothetical protein
MYGPAVRCKRLWSTLDATTLFGAGPAQAAPLVRRRMGDPVAGARKPHRAVVDRVASRAVTYNLERHASPPIIKRALALAALAAVRSFRHAGPRCRRRCPLNSRGVRLSARTGGHTQLQFRSSLWRAVDWWTGRRRDPDQRRTCPSLHLRARRAARNGGRGAKKRTSFSLGRLPDVTVGLIPARTCA